MMGRLGERAAVALLVREVLGDSIVFHICGGL